jgi:hypothetical protein
MSAECVRRGLHNATIPGELPGAVVFCPRCGAVLTCEGDGGVIRPMTAAELFVAVMGPRGPDIERIQRDIWLQRTMELRASCDVIQAIQTPGVG